MTIELALCLLCMIATFPVSKSISAHYAVFAWVNYLFIGIEYADASLLAMVFAVLAIADMILLSFSGRKCLAISAIASIALSLESVGNGDWLLNHIEWISIATNAVILGSIGKEYLAWMRGKFSH